MSGVQRNPIRVATAVISQRIFAGRPTKDGRGFKEPRYDVTSDVLTAIRDKVGIGNEIEVGLPGAGVEFRIAVLPPYTTTPAQGLDAATIERCADVFEEIRQLATPAGNVWKGDEPEWQSTIATLAYSAGEALSLNTASTTTRGEDARLREALEPFAREADAQERVTSFRDGNCVIPRTKITIGQLRRARAALQGDAAHTSQEKGNG